MDFKQKSKEALEKLQGLPDVTKKMIMFVLVAAIGLVLAFLWLKQSESRLERMQNDIKQIQFPKIEFPKK